LRCTPTIGRLEAKGVFRTRGLAKRATTLATIFLSVVISWTGSPEARAAFAGENGRIVFSGSVTRDGGPSDERFVGLCQAHIYADTCSPLTLGRDPAWSADGSRLAFVRTRNRSDGEVLVVAADGSAIRRLTDDRTWDSGPTWSPDGQRIAYTCGRRVCTIGVDGSHRDVLRRGYGPTWSPDGDWLAYASERNEHGHLFLMRPDGSHNHRVPGLPRETESPDWSPDGRLLVFTEDRANYLAGVSVIRPDGSHYRRLVDRYLDFYLALEEHPSWSPDGRQVLFSRTWVDSEFDNDFYWREPFVVRRDGSHEHRLTVPVGSDDQLSAAWRPIR
jgi:Tol biopolymer transport system component